MSDAEHLLENVIFAMKENRDVNQELSHWPNTEMLKNTGIRKDDLIRMASHVVYFLYNGKFPGESYDPSDWNDL